MTMHFKLTESQQDALNTLMLQQQNPASANYHQWLTPEQYAGSFGLSQSDFARAVAWLQQQGFSIDETARSRSWVAFSGTADQVTAAFHTEIHRYSVAGRIHYANATEPSIPTALAGVVEGIRSLDDFRPAPKSIRRRISATPNPRFTSSVSGDHFIAPADFATIYDVQSLYNTGITGSGVKIAVMGQTDIVVNDITEFRAAAGLPANNPTVVDTPAHIAITSSGDLTEADLDLEWSGAVARNASITYVNSGNSANGAFDSLAYAIDNNVAPVISISYGGCEQIEGATTVTAIQTMLEQATAQGETVVGAAGDAGATDCDNIDPSAPTDIATNGLAVDFPASSPNVTGVGGTEFYNDTTTGGNSYWSASNNSTTQGSAVSYIPEMVWNDTAADGELSGGGGGASIFFTKPVWQTGTGVPSDDARDVPDITISASPDHDPYLICSSDYTNQDSGVTDCTSGFRASDQTLDVIGGSSVGPPTFSGIVALIVQKTGSAQGNVNAILYPLAAAVPDAFHDITNGNNQEPCEMGSIDCPSGGQIGFVAGPGYDQASGLGSYDAFNLVSKWTSVKPHTGATPDFAFSSNPATVSVAAGASTSATLTVVPNNGFTGTVTVACSVASALSGVTCSVSPSTIASTGTTSLTVSASTGAGLHGLMRFFGPGWPQALLLLAFSLIFGEVGLAAVKPRWALPKATTVPRLAWLAILMACLVAASVSCGGGGSSSTTTTTTTTTSETGNVSITATSGSLTHTVQVGVSVD